MDLSRVGAALLPPIQKPRRVALGLVRVVETAITSAWEGRAADLPGIVEAASKQSKLEVALNALVAVELDRLLHAETVPGFDCNTFSAVSREAQVVSFDGKQLEKQPDIAISLADPKFGVAQFEQVFVEAKVVCKKRNIQAEYADNGVARFARGEYGWAMSDALMLGYCTQPSRTWVDLDSALKNSTSAAAVLIDGQTLAFSPVPTAAPQSLHARPWVYPITQGQPGHIRLWHVWLLLPADKPIDEELTVAAA